jgi:hypothetical protein
MSIFVDTRIPKSGGFMNALKIVANTPGYYKKWATTTSGQRSGK